MYMYMYMYEEHGEQAREVGGDVVLYTIYKQIQITRNILHVYVYVYV